MGFAGNLTCRGCGLTFTATWGGVSGADEYRCRRDHVLYVSRTAGNVVAVDGVSVDGPSPSLADLRGACPVCGSELATGKLPHCPVCGGRDHDVQVAGTFS